MNRYITKFCLKHPNFGVPGLMRYISIGSAVFWVMGLMMPVFASYLTFSPYHIMHGQIWRIISFVFIPPNTSILGIIAIYFYYVIGTTLEQAWGSARFNLFMCSGYVMTLLFGFILYFAFGIAVSGITATYIFLSMFFAFAILYPDAQALYMFLIPVKMIWLAAINLLFFIVQIFSSSFPFNLLPVIAIINILLFCWDNIKGFIKRR